MALSSQELELWQAGVDREDGEEDQPSAVDLTGWDAGLNRQLGPSVASLQQWIDLSA